MGRINPLPELPLTTEFPDHEQRRPTAIEELPARNLLLNDEAPNGSVV